MRYLLLMYSLILLSGVQYFNLSTFVFKNEFFIGMYLFQIVVYEKQKDNRSYLKKHNDIIIG